MTGVDGGVFAEDGAVADADAGGGVTEFELEVLRGEADGGAGVEDAVFADVDGAGHLDGGDELGVVAQANAAAEDAPGADLDAGTQFAFRVDDSGGVDGVHGGC